MGPFSSRRGMHRGLTLLELLVIVLTVMVIGAIFYPVFAQPRGRPYRGYCLSNLKQVALGFLMYAEDEDHRAPLSRHWMDSLYPYVKSETIYHCPFVQPPSPQVYGYAMKQSLAGKDIAKLKDPALVPMVFDTDLPFRSAATNNLPSFDFDRHNHPNFAYADGHARMMSHP